MRSYTKIKIKRNEDRVLVQCMNACRLFAHIEFDCVLVLSIVRIPLLSTITKVIVNSRIWTNVNNCNEFRLRLIAHSCRGDINSRNVLTIAKIDTVNRQRERFSAAHEWTFVFIVIFSLVLFVHLLLSFKFLRKLSGIFCSAQIKKTYKTRTRVSVVDSEQESHGKQTKHIISCYSITSMS